MRWLTKLFVVAIVASSGSSAYSQSPGHKVLYARNNTWPQPFRAADAQSVVAPFEVMKANGWRENNTLGSPVFDTDNALSKAGTLKVQWIVTLAPQSQRVIYVKSGPTQDATAARLESVQLAVSELVPTGPLPQILVTDLEPPTSSGSYQTLVHRALIRSTPNPRLPPFGGGINAPSQQTVAPSAQQAGTASSGNTGR